MCREFVVVQRFGRNSLLGAVPVGQASTAGVVYLEFRRSGLHIPKDANGRMTGDWLPVSHKVNTDAN